MNSKEIHTEKIYYIFLPDSSRARKIQNRDARVNNGFKPLDTEWWHFTLKEKTYPAPYFNFPVSKEVVK